LMIPCAALLERNQARRHMPSAAARGLEIASCSSHPAFPKLDQHRIEAIQETILPELLTRSIPKRN
jgi:hypothetical protein